MKFKIYCSTTDPQNTEVRIGDRWYSLDGRVHYWAPLTPSTWWKEHRDYVQAKHYGRTWRSDRPGAWTAYTHFVAEMSYSRCFLWLALGFLAIWLLCI
jgi:hypothetical protein